MITDDDRKRIIDAIALLEQVLRESDATIQSAAVLRALAGAEQKPPGALSSTQGMAGAGGGGGDYGRENTSRWHRRL